MQDLFTANGFSAADRDAARSGVPRTIYFLEKEYIARYWTMAALPPERLDETAAFAASLQREPESRVLLWHLYTAYCLRCPAPVFPEELPDSASTPARSICSSCLH